MHFKSNTLLILLPTTSLVTARAIPAIVPRDAPASLPRITSISYSGTGCPSSSPGVVRTGTAFSDSAFRLNGFEASLPGIETSTANCQVHIQSAGCTSGWQVGVTAATVKGHLVLDPGASLDWYLTSFWSSEAADSTTITGSVPNNAATRLDADINVHATTANVAWSPCTGADGVLDTLNVNFRVALDAPGNQYGYFGKDADTAAAEVWEYVWRRC
ncbi:hypothetical protein GGR57DRAFT_418863 [Xylariaceae sp. FL1272]|nr:hypothetical protein GGR57DRAFT_418863 [Xylariaceae sp. FL1272]